MSQSKKICKNCNWFTERGWCNLEPKAEMKMADDFCSHWTPKMLTEEKWNCCGKGVFLEN